LDAGITGLDLLLDSKSKAVEVADLGFGGSTFRFAVGNESSFKELQDLKGKRIATAYPSLLTDFLSKEGVSAEVVRLDGAVESAIKLGVADAIADVVSTGNTLRKANLRIIGPVLLKSTARLIASPGKSELSSRLLRRIEGVIVAREYVLMDYDCPKELIEKAIAITPGFESPTISPLADENWVAVRALVRSSETNNVMDQLSDLGAKAILVTSIHAARI
jgi:ATP phosphoribosyltransferase